MQSNYYLKYNKYKKKYLNLQNNKQIGGMIGSLDVPSGGGAAGTDVAGTDVAGTDVAGTVLLDLNKLLTIIALIDPESTKKINVIINNNSTTAIKHFDDPSIRSEFTLNKTFEELEIQEIKSKLVTEKNSKYLTDEIFPTIHKLDKLSIIMTYGYINEFIINNFNNLPIKKKYFFIISFLIYIFNLDSDIIMRYIQFPYVVYDLEDPNSVLVVNEIKLQNHFLILNILMNMYELYIQMVENDTSLNELIRINNFRIRMNRIISTKYNRWLSNSNDKYIPLYE